MRGPGRLLKPMLGLGPLLLLEEHVHLENVHIPQQQRDLRSAGRS